MPNHVSHKILFEAKRADEVFAAVCPDGRFDFNTLVPEPPQMYHGDLSRDDDEDFKCNWSTWHIANWGTKWNAYEASCHVHNGMAVIAFDTAWSVPYPVLAAFNNRFQVPFEHRYYDEGANFWGIECWATERAGERIVRTVKRKSVPGDKRGLCMELKGYDPEAEEAA